MAEQVLQTDSDEQFWSFLNGNEEKPEKIPDKGKVLINKEEKKQNQIGEEEKHVARDVAKKLEDKKEIIPKRQNQLQEALNRLDELGKLGVDESDGDDFDVDELFEKEEEDDEDKYIQDYVVLKQLDDRRIQDTTEEKEAPAQAEVKLDPPCPELNPDTWLLQIFGNNLPLMTQAFGIVTAGLGLSTIGLIVKVMWDAFRIIRHRIYNN